MATYAFLCPACGEQYWAHVSSARLGPPQEVFCQGAHKETVAMRRDYATENVGVGSGVRVSRDGTNKDIDRLFMPDNKDFAGPGDPDGYKGMRNWRETHLPKDDNYKPRWPGEVEKKVW
jgi:hypothetical protein